MRTPLRRLPGKREGRRGVQGRGSVRAGLGPPTAPSSSPPRPPACRSRIEQLRLLSKLEQSGLLSQLERSGVTLSALEKSGALSAAEKLGALSLLGDRNFPGAL